MIKHQHYSNQEIRRLIRNEEILWAGNIRDKIYGTIRCSSGKRMKKENRIFFKTETEAILSGFRPCGHCLRSRYVSWKGGK